MKGRTGASVWYFVRNGDTFRHTAVKTSSLAITKGSFAATSMVSYDEVAGLLTSLDLTAATYLRMLGHIWRALSATGKFSTHRCPQKGRAKVLLAGTFKKRKWRGLNIFSICQELNPALTALWRVWRPHIPTTASCFPPLCSPCSYWSISKNFQFTFGPSIEIDTIPRWSRSLIHSWRW